MTGKEIYRQALALLNYSDADGNATADADLHKRALALVNQIYADLWHISNSGQFHPLTALSNQIDLETQVLTNVMPYGVAMLIAQTDGDADNQALYANLYNQRRPSARSRNDRIEDRQPRVFL